MKKDIRFYSRDDEYGWLSNFERSPQEIDGIVYPTNEHYYQAQKSKNKKLKEWIALAPIPFHAMKAGRALRKNELVKNWDTIKFDIMLKGLRAKFSQNVELKCRLVATGNLSLHEDSPTDMIWGIKGKDILGKLLMQVRREMHS